MVQADEAADGMVRIGHYLQFEPFGFVADGRSQGMLIELVEAILAQASVAYRFVPMVLEQTDAAVTSGEIDAVAFLGVTAERGVKMDFSDPLIMTGAAVFGKGEVPAVTNLADYAGRIVVTPAQGPLAASIAKEHPRIRLLTVDSYDASLQAVLAGTADAAALNFQVGTQLINRKYRGLFNLPAAPYAALPMAFAVAKGRQAALLRAFNESLARIQAGGQGDAIVRRWMGQG